MPLDFDVYTTADKAVSKYVHEDGSETAIKLVKSVQSVVNPLLNRVETRHTDRNKYSIFVSSSVGCYMHCPFCHLTIKDAKYKPLTADQILTNLQDALTHKIAEAPELKDRYLKLSWMGMGDAINIPVVVYRVTLAFLDWVFANGYAKGLDGVDLSTVLPSVRNSWIEEFQVLDLALERYPLNPVHTMDNVAAVVGTQGSRRPFRLFYSVHSAIQAKRNVVVPGAMPLAKAIPLLQKYWKEGRHTLVLHHLLVEGLNDTEEELQALIDLMNSSFPAQELRILRYNFCARSPFKESDKFLRQVRQLSDAVSLLKVQVSPGTEVSAACGQFIVKQFARRA